MRRYGAIAFLAGLFTLVAAQPALALPQTLTFVSDNTWVVTDADLATGPALALPGFAQKVCLNSGAPVPCPAGATLYGYPFTGAWLANLSSIPGAAWIWAPGITGATAAIEFDQYFFTTTMVINGTPTAGTIKIAADNFAEIRVNGTVVGSVGSATVPTPTSFNTLTSFNILPYLVSGANTIVVRGQNGVLGGCPSCTHSQNPAGVVFGGSITFETDDDGQANDHDDGQANNHDDGQANNHDDGQGPR